ncbi:MAG: ABC transporter permease [Chloroflexi bacterium]|nr:MAG: ABC transporter permease [Chloroflexota bacterium]HDN79086.1 ABC transporter permease [Chloroflexota bacterium]
MKDFRQKVVTAISIAFFLALWKSLTWWCRYPSFILPPPEEVARRFMETLADGTLLRHTRITLLEIAVGLALGLSAAFVLGYVLAKIPLMEFFLSPLIIASQSVPIVALAPLLVIWFGFGILSKILVCALTVFFPVLVSTIVGIRSVEPELRDLMRVLKANQWQTFTKLELPAALPVMLGGLKVGVTLSVIGAVVGEFVGADRGLGFLVNLARGLFDTPLLFVALGTLAAIAITLYSAVNALEKCILRWRY